MRKAVLTLTFLMVVICMIYSCVNENGVKYQRYFSDGSQIYKDHCQSCHMNDGNGLAALIPGLTDSTFLRKNRQRLPCFVANGLNDSIQINGKDFQGVMPAEKHLAPIDIAKVLTYVTNSFGNQQGIYEVTDVQKNLNNCN